jgi:hypothetical protein
MYASKAEAISYMREEDIRVYWCSLCEEWTIEGPSGYPDCYCS